MKELKEAKSELQKMSFAGRKVEVEVEVEVEVVQVVQVGQVDQEGLYGAARAAKHKKWQTDKKTK